VPSVDLIVHEFRERRSTGGRVQVRADDLTQAVAVAEALKASGDAQWFRGQTRDWPKLAPTFHRLTEEETALAEQQLMRYLRWAKSTPGLEDLAANDDMLIAVAQHYGIPTTFIDFTTEPRVAGFFATDGEPPPEGVESCIICLDIDEAKSTWQSVGEALHHELAELLELDVANLWRLEAQHGTFVWCPYDDLDGPYPLDRIFFPYTGTCEIARDAIYPERESPLESLLNQYFQEEEIRLGSIFLKTELSELPVTRLQMGELPGFDPDAFIAAPDPHPSWAAGALSAWFELERERWSDTAAAISIPLRFDTDQSLELLREHVSSQISEALDNEPALRRIAPRWQVTTETGDGDFDALLARALQRLWDGMSRLPYTDDEIVTAMGTTAAFCSALSNLGERDAAASAILADPVALELGGGGVNVHARAWVDDASLRAAVREDFVTLLIPEERERRLGLTFNLLMSARDPRVLFDFEKLKALFAHEIIPTQIALDARNPTIFSPARLDVIGPA
jgi:hypothetical protein